MPETPSNPTPRPPTVVLAVDTGSPVASVALAVDGAVVAEKTMPQRETSRFLLPGIDACLKAASLELEEVDGLVALQGPGSFTGLRIGLATLLGLHQATGIPATAVPTLHVLAAAARREDDGAPHILAVVDAFRGAWFAQAFAPGAPPRPLTPPAWTPVEELAPLATGDRSATTSERSSEPPALVVGFGVEPFAELESWPAGTRFWEPPPLAVPTALLATELVESWDAGELGKPLYLRPPAVSRPKAPKSALPPPRAS